MRFPRIKLRREPQSASAGLRLPFHVAQVGEQERFALCLGGVGEPAKTIRVRVEAVDGSLPARVGTSNM